MYYIPAYRASHPIAAKVAFVFEPWRYLLVMKGRPAEYAAFAQLRPEIAAAVTPLIQLWAPAKAPSGDDGAEEGASVTPEPQAQQGLWPTDPGADLWGRLFKGLLAMGTWPSSRPIIIDGGWLGDAVFGSVVNNARAAGHCSLLVTGLDRGEAHQGIVADAINRDSAGVVLRLGRADFEPSSEPIANRINHLLDRLGVTADQVDIILDLRAVERLNRERDELILESMLRSLPDLRRWRNVATAASSMPPNATGFPTDDVKPFDRVEWWIHKELRTRRSVVGRLPVFGDYGVIHPDPVEPTGDARRFVRIPQIRYAAGDRALMIRGVDLRQDPGGRLGEVFASLIAGGDIASPDFSAGDRWIHDVARGEDGPGSFVTWKRVSQNHHVTHVSFQLASSSEP